MIFGVFCCFFGVILGRWSSFNMTNDLFDGDETFRVNYTGSGIVKQSRCQTSPNSHLARHLNPAPPPTMPPLHRKSATTLPKLAGAAEATTVMGRPTSKSPFTSLSSLLFLFFLLLLLPPPVWLIRGEISFN